MLERPNLAGHRGAEICLKQIKHHIIVRSIKKGADFQLIGRDGSRLSWLIDLREVLLDPAVLDGIAAAVLDRLPDNELVQIGGVETAAIPLVTAVLLKAHQRGRPLSGFLIRKERKTTGLGRIIEGQVRPDLPVVLLDDILNFGESLERARVVLEAEGLRISRIVVVIDFEAAPGIEWRNRNGLVVESLFQLNEFGISNSKRTIPPPDVCFTPAWSFTSIMGHPFALVPKSAPLLLNGQVVLGTDAGVVLAIDTATGREVWRQIFPNCGRKGIWSSPAYHAGRLYIGAYNGCLYCLDAATGEIAWRTPACEWIGSSPLVVERHNLVVVGLEYERPGRLGSLAAFNLATGEKVWEHWLRAYQHGSAAYWSEGDLVVAGTGDHSLLAVRAIDGAPAWELPTGRSIKYAPAIDPVRRLVASASFDGSIRVCDVATGRLLHELRTDDICYTTPLFHGDRLFCGSGDRRMYVLDLGTGKRVAALECGARVYASPRSIGQSVVFGASNGVVRELDAATLRLRGAFTVPDAVTNAVAVSDDGALVIATTYTNGVFAFRRDET